jgi:hypothetical protein
MLTNIRSGILSVRAANLEGDHLGCWLEQRWPRHQHHRGYNHCGCRGPRSLIQTLGYRENDEHLAQADHLCHRHGPADNVSIDDSHASASCSRIGRVVNIAILVLVRIYNGRRADLGY